MNPILEIENLSIGLHGGRRIVENVSLSVMPGTVLGIVGESGGGKTLLLRSLLRELPEGVVHQGGSAWIALPDGLAGAFPKSPESPAWVRGHSGARQADLVAVPPRLHRRLLGRALAYVPQDPLTALDPLQTAGSSIVEALRAHVRCSTDQEAREVVRALVGAGESDGARIAKSRPDALSGGQRQRVLIAQAQINRPSVVLYDEPVTALDPGTKVGVLGAIRRRARSGESAIVVSHDLGAIGLVADVIAVLYLGRVVEFGTAQQVLNEPRHPYTQGLVRCILPIDRVEPIQPIRGHIPEGPWCVGGCKFHPRCLSARGRTDCLSEEPVLQLTSSGRKVACHAVR